MGGGEALCAFSNKVDVRRLLEDEAGGVDGVAEALDTGYATGFHAAAVHEESVELDAAVGGEKAASAGVEGRVIFKDGDGGFDGIEGGAAAGEDCVALFEGVADTGFVGFGCIGGDGPCAAVDEEDGVADGGSRHGVMVTQTRWGAPAVRQTRLAPQESNWQFRSSRQGDRGRTASAGLALWRALLMPEIDFAMRCEGCRGG